MEAEGGLRRGPSALSAARLALAAFVVAWLFDLFALRSTVPVWLPFLVALGLELHFFLSARRSAPIPREPANRLPQVADRERYGYDHESDELLLVRRDGEELWIPYSGEADEDVDALVAEAREQEERQASAPVPSLPERGGARPYRQLLLGLGVLAALGAVVWVAESRSGWSGLDRETRAEAADRFSAEASRIAGHRVVIRCDERGDYVGAVQHADGVAEIGGGVAYLTPERCYDLYRLALEGEVLGSQTARAVAVLAHEAWHLRGVRNEGTTECYALQSGVEIGRRLGLSEAAARQMMRQQLVENSLRRGAATEYLVPAECRDGGELDLDPASSDFP
ncbi:MAG: hypothetical protein M3322_08680 [Actinomycetota bacterium]|nr:hypothetical protein [Actinomycetota bacterium]